ncbi:MAG: Fe-S cluster assembly protein SufD [Chromatiales bacterium]|jgi:Fe-S cluster assembly protein SufD|nr:Fe-S cluster assembly protein SufD [Chromatiales bacterium]
MTDTALTPGAAQMRAAHARLRERLPAGWPTDASGVALESFLTRGLPGTDIEEWRYTSLAAFAGRLASALEASAEAAAQPAADPPLAAALRAAVPGPVLCLTDGQLEPGADLPAGLQIRPAARLLPGLAPVGISALADLNAAFARDGLNLAVAANAGPQGVLLIHERAASATTVGQPRVRLSLAGGSHLSVVLLATGGSATTSNAVVEVDAEAGSVLHLVQLHEGAAGAQRIARTELRLGAGASARVTSVDLGSSLSRQDVVVHLAGDDASVDVAGLCAGPSGTHVDHHLDLQHAGRHTASRTLYRSVVDSGGRVVFNGRIVVGVGAAGSDAALTNRNLLLGPGAEIDTKPELEIHTDDVRCSHGATTGQLDPAALFYLRSRGVPAAEARRLLIGAFADELLARIGLPTAEAALRNRIHALLEAAGGLAQ